MNDGAEHKSENIRNESKTRNQTLRNYFIEFY